MSDTNAVIDRIEKEAQTLLSNLSRDYKSCVRESVADILKDVRSLRTPPVQHASFDLAQESNRLSAEQMPPRDIIDAAYTVGRWFAERNITSWELGPCAGRNFALVHEQQTSPDKSLADRVRSE